MVKTRSQSHVAVVGFGYIGSVLGAAMADCGHAVTGIDVDSERIAQTNRGATDLEEPGLRDMLAAAVAAGRLRASDDFAAVSSADVVVITVGTPLGSDGHPHLGAVREAALAVGEHLRPGTVVIVKSTVIPNTTRHIVREALERTSSLQMDRDLYLAFCPERLAEGNAMTELKRLPIIVGADSSETRSIVSSFWERTLGVETIPVSSTVAAELVKLASNLWIDANIAIANQLSKLARDFGSDFKEVAPAANTLPKGEGRVNILHSSLGVGGSCLTKDPLFVAGMLEEHGHDAALFRATRRVNDDMPRYTASLIVDWCSANNKPAGMVSVYGLAFKNNTNDTRSTPVLPLLQALREHGLETRLFDPLVSQSDTRAVFGQSQDSADLYAAAEGADVVCFACTHDCFFPLDLQALARRAAEPALLVDGRKRLDAAEARAAGFAYVAI